MPIGSIHTTIAFIQWAVFLTYKLQFTHVILLHCNSLNNFNKLQNIGSSIVCYGEDLKNYWMIRKIYKCVLGERTTIGVAVISSYGMG